MDWVEKLHMNSVEQKLLTIPKSALSLTEPLGINGDNTRPALFQFILNYRRKTNSIHVFYAINL